MLKISSVKLLLHNNVLWICRPFSDRKIVQEVLAQITWYHNVALMDKVKTAEEHIWYANATVQNGWSRNVLVH